MRFGDERAVNLFARLFTYAPRSEERSELENYCTEALAWCLIKCSDFAAELIDTIASLVYPAKPVTFDNLRARLRVDTQIGFRGQDLVAEDADSRKSSHSEQKRGGLFDILLTTGQRNDTLVAHRVQG
jgi:hypothetical protein